MATVEVQYRGRQGTRHPLETNEDLVAVRTWDQAPVADTRLSSEGRGVLDRLEPVEHFPHAGVEVFHVRTGAAADRDHVRGTLNAERNIRFAGRVLADPVFEPGVPQAPGERRKDPVLYTENLFVKFSGTERESVARRRLAARDLEIKRRVEYLDNAFFVGAREGTGLGVFEIALAMLGNEPGVEICHPELVRKRRVRTVFPQQWHLRKTRVGGVTIEAHADIVRAWKYSRGRGVVIAVIDEGIDIDHEEFTAARKIVAAHDATSGSHDPTDPRPRFSREKHGTSVAGVACAIGRKGASGVAPAARLMPIRLDDDLGSQSEADAIAYAADHGADVISCSWGPDDGEWWNPRDPAHRAFVPLPDSTRLAIEYAVSQGRRGRGCVICWAAGNGNEAVDNDGYASFPAVIAVAACNDAGTRSVYSDTGQALWCAFPSDDDELQKVTHLPHPPPRGGVWTVNHPAPRTPGIWTTDVSGPRGYNRGSARAGDEAGNYTNGFGGTSSATPGVAGVVALVLAVNPNLTHDEVKDVLKRSCDRIDEAHGHYDDVTGHSPLYGYGRVNALTAVRLAGTPRGLRRRHG